MKRMFIAIEIKNNKALADLIASYRSALAGEKIRWVNPSGMHLTLAFLGDIDEQQQEEAAKVLRKTTHGFEPFTIEFKGVGLFRDLRRPRVLWLGIESGDTLYEMRSVLCRRLKEEGLLDEEKPFRPHLTLGRMKGIENRERLSDLLSEVYDHKLPPQHVSEVILYESILSPGSPATYRRVEEAELRYRSP
ncbi:MAG: RNA 2',3'-cyclic phosphodiesterase [Bacteroidales bacterium]